MFSLTESELQPLLHNRSLVSVVTAALAVGGGFFTRWAFLHFLSVDLPYMLFFPWLVAACLLAAPWTGPLTLAGFILFSLTALRPTTLISTHSPLAGLLLFSLMGLGLIVLTAWARRLHSRERQALKTLRESEHRLHVALEAGNMGTWEWDLATNCVTWSPGLEYIHARPPGSFKGTPEDAFADTHPDDRARIQTVIHAALAGKSEYRVEYRIRTPEGAERWIEARGTVLFAPSGAPTRMLGVCMDITPRKQWEESIRRNEKQLRVIADAFPALIAYVDKDQRYVFNSSAYEVWHALPRDQIQGMRLCDAVPNYELIRPNVEAALSGKPVRYQARVNYRDGVARDVDITYAPDIDASGQVRGFSSLVVDISERLRAEEQIRASQQRYQALAETVPGFVWSLTVDGLIDYLNPQYTQFTGLTLDRINTDWASVVHPDDIPLVSMLRENAFHRGEPFELEYRFRRASDAQYRWFLTRTIPVRDESNQIVRWVGSATDVHEAKMATEDRERLLAAERKAREEAEHASAVKDQFLATLSHELRTPLTPALLTLSLLEGHTGLPQDAREDLQVVRRNVELEARLIDDLLDLTRIARGKIQYDYQTVDAHLLVRSAIAICCTDGKLTVECDLAAPNHHVRADPARLQQIFWNLLNNAWKFTPPGGKLTIRSYATPEDGIRFQITDTGAGIDPAALPRIFDAFEQVDAIRARRFGGLGLGLAITKALVDAHAGSITAFSRGPDTGATFTLDFPTIPAPITNTPTPTPSTLELTTPKPLRVLLVEDHPITLKVLTRLLTQMGHDVTGADCLAKGLSAARGTTYDLLISDLGLPDGTGHDLMRQLRDLYHIQGIALSGYGMEEDIARSREAGFSEHVVKPVDVNKLSAVIARLT